MGARAGGGGGGWGSDGGNGIRQRVRGLWVWWGGAEGALRCPCNAKCSLPCAAQLAGPERAAGGQLGGGHGARWPRGRGGARRRARTWQRPKGQGGRSGVCVWGGGSSCWWAGSGRQRGCGTTASSCSAACVSSGVLPPLPQLPCLPAAGCRTRSGAWGTPCPCLQCGPPPPPLFCPFIPLRNTHPPPPCRPPSSRTGACQLGQR